MEIINAVREGDQDAVQRWFQDNPDAAANQLVSLGVSAAHWAASGADAQILRELLTRIPELKDSRDASDGATPLHWAAQDGRTASISCLLQFNANLFAVDGSGETALHYASMNGHLECARVLVRAGGAKLVGMASDDGNTALHLATMNRHMRTMAVLLQEGGANPNQPNKFGQSPLSIAQSKRDQELLSYFDPEKMVLLERIESLTEDNAVLEQRLQLLVHEKETEIKKTMHAYKQITSLESDLMVANQRAAEAEERLKRGELQYLQLQQQLEATLAEMQKQSTLVSSLQQQLIAAQQLQHNSLAQHIPPQHQTQSFFPERVRAAEARFCQGIVGHIAADVGRCWHGNTGFKNAH
eukprot:TRINITY_DN1077_c0_g1_i2.p1 TRINITY_DN1077_c0_g1~~TRINITY_DN1077_c0_g1_i2.p1  ORF type:complete len:379 (-),score=51.42 TRINITY_DN1077_c0_g1_i2:676-1740(-)